MRQTLQASFWIPFFVLLFAACSPPADRLPYLDLNQRSPLPAAAAAEIVPLRLAVAAIISPQGTVESYSELADYLRQKLDRPVELVQRRTYAEVNELVASNQIDLAFVCTSAYLEGSDKLEMNLLVAPEINGQTVYHSALIVHRNNTATSMADLRGSVFAFTDPMSFTGRSYPTYLVHQLRETPESFFQRTIVTYSHDRAIHAVADGVADAAAVDSIILDYALHRHPDLAEKIRVIHRSQPFGIPPVVSPPGLPIRQAVLLQEILLTMHRDEVGRRVLEHLGIDRFVKIEDHIYDEARLLVRQIEDIAWTP
jgi:phosphonate transport system substrate-binding protein